MGLTAKSKADIAAIRDRLPEPRSALLPALWLAQADYGGWLPEAALDEVAGLLNLPPTLVAATASFYSMFHREPLGQHLLQVCTNIACSLLGADHILDYLRRRLAVGPGETTPDGRFTLVEVECLGSCGTAPVMQVDDVHYENLTEDKIDQILSTL